MSTNTSTATTFTVETIAEQDLDRARGGGLDVSGNPVAHVTLTGGEPLRCCLRDGEPGEAAILFGYEPRLPASPYREIGPVFAHATPCDGPESRTDYPTAWRGRPQVLRAYDRRGWIHAARVHDGDDPESVIGELLADPAVEQIHSRNVAYGCYMFTIRRTAPSAPRAD
jgi:Protein of unknown function (DUF1203)